MNISLCLLILSLSLIDEAAFKDENGVRISIFIPLVFVFTKKIWK